MPRSYGGAGAVWDIWPRAARDGLKRYLLAHAAEFRAEGVAIADAILDPIHDQARARMRWRSPCLSVHPSMHLQRRPPMHACVGPRRGHTEMGVHALVVAQCTRAVPTRGVISTPEFGHIGCAA